MKIIIDNGTYNLRNHGDISMLQVAVERLHKLWPNALIQVVTEAPDLLATYCPNARPLSSRDRQRFLQNQGLFSGVQHLLPSKIYNGLLMLEKMIQYHYPLFVQPWIRWRMKNPRIDAEDMNTFFRALSNADLVIASGGGYITDIFHGHSTTVLRLIGMAIQLGKSTAMFGQGLGPVQSRKLITWAKSVLPSVDLIALRESRVGPAFLASLGVEPTRVFTTGDDAIELAYKAHTTEKIRTGIGVNLRIAPYSEAGKNHIETVRATLQDIAMKHNAPLIPLPISLNCTESDLETIRQILAGYDDTSDGGQSLDNPFKVIEQVGRCRVVVTGSYHSAVFALAQGIPVVGLAKSAYYIDKFLGLADQFGTGCEVVFLDDENLHEKLKAAIDVAWRSAEQVKAPLLEAAKRQIALSRKAYERIYEIVESKKAKPLS